MKCYNCRAEVPEDARFCPKCGCPQQFTKELIDRAVSDDQEAIGQLYNMTYNNVYLTVKSMVQDEDIILDLVQDTYVRGFNNLSRLKNPQAFRGWIKRIGHNLTVDYLRKKKPRTFSSMVSTDSDEMLDFVDERTCNMPEAVMDQRETTRLISEILDTLSDEQRFVVGMFYYQQMSVKEIAEELGVSENTVKSRLSYGRKRIEIQVRELEKKGTKLYSLAPIPFLLWLFKSMDTQAAYHPNQEILRNIQNRFAADYTEPEDSFHTRRKAPDIATEIAETATGAAGKSTITKIIIGIVATAIVGGTIAGAVALNNKEEEEPEVQEEVVNEIEDEEENEDVSETEDTETRQALYQNILDQHMEACGINDNEYLANVEKYQAQYPDVCTEIVPYHQYGMNLYYTYHDIDGNGVEELVIGSEQERGIIPVALYTYNKNGEQVILACNSSTFNRSLLSVMSDGTMYQYLSGGAESSGAELLKIAEDGYTLESTGISIEEYEQEINEHTEADFDWKILEVDKSKNQSDFTEYQVDMFLGTYANNYYGLELSEELNRIKCVSGSNRHGGWLVFEYDICTR